jgi:peptidoglycan glycosyltransferase
MSRPIMRLFLLLVLLFAVLVAWTSRWTVFEAKALRDNSENVRPLLQQLHVKRGSILADDHTVLARSVKAKAGTYTRRYPLGSLFGHPLGYANVALKQLSGLEQFRNDELSGQGNELDSIVTQLQGKRQAGDNVVTTLDPKAQKVATDALGGQAGSVVALDPRTGAVKVMVSTPGYDPNAIGDSKVFKALNAPGSGAPLLDRATQGQYPPGSTFKVLTAAAAIDSGRYTPSSTIDGDSPRRVSGVDLQNDYNQSFGDITLTDALTQSVNTVFAQVAERLGRGTMTEYMKRFGFYGKPQLDYPENQMVSSGERDPRTGRLLLPTSSRVDLGRMGIGQDKLAVTPLQMAEVVAAVANGGKLMKPHLTDRIVDPDGRTVKSIAPSEQSQPIKPATATALNQMMRNVVEEGTGTAVQLPGVSVAGKTGTAQKGSQGSNITQPWFVAFAPADHPQIAIAVTVEKSDGGFGGTVAAPIARQVLLSLLHP